MSESIESKNKNLKEEQFFLCFNEFLDDIKNTFPEYRTVIENNYENIKQSDMIDFINVLEPIKENIASKVRYF